MKRQPTNVIRPTTGADLQPPPALERNDDLLKLELNVRLEEYRALRAEIVANLTASYQTVNLTLAAIGALVASSNLILVSHQLLIFPLASVIIYGLTWTQLRYVFSIYTISNYLIAVVEPAIRDNLKLLSIDTSRDFSTVIAWESEGRKDMYSPHKWEMPLETARYGLPILTAVGSFATYVVLMIHSSQWQWWRDGSLTLANVLLLGYTSFVCLRLRSMHHTKLPIVS